MSQELHGVLDKVNLILTIIFQGKHYKSYHMIENFQTLLLFEIRRECAVVSVGVFVFL